MKQTFIVTVDARSAIGPETVAAATVEGLEGSNAYWRNRLDSVSAQRRDVDVEFLRDLGLKSKDIKILLGRNHS